VASCGPWHPGPITSARFPRPNSASLSPAGKPMTLLNRSLPAHISSTHRGAPAVPAAATPLRHVRYESAQGRERLSNVIGFPAGEKASRVSGWKASGCYWPRCHGPQLATSTDGRRECLPECLIFQDPGTFGRRAEDCPPYRLLVVTIRSARMQKAPLFARGTASVVTRIPTTVGVWGYELGIFP